MLLEELETALAAWYKQACASSTSIVNKILREKVSQITACWDQATTEVLVARSTDLRGDAALLIELQWVKAGVLIQKQQITEKLLTVARDYNADKTGLFSIYDLVKVLLFVGTAALMEQNLNHL